MRKSIERILTNLVSDKIEDNHRIIRFLADIQRDNSTHDQSTPKLRK
jgi:hypothetical protein